MLQRSQLAVDGGIGGPLRLPVSDIGDGGLGPAEGFPTVGAVLVVSGVVRSCPRTTRHSEASSTWTRRPGPRARTRSPRIAAGHHPHRNPQSQRTSRSGRRHGTATRYFRAPCALLRPSGVTANQLPRARSIDVPASQLSSTSTPVTMTKSPCVKVSYSSWGTSLRSTRTLQRACGT